MYEIYIHVHLGTNDQLLTVRSVLVFVFHERKIDLKIKYKLCSMFSILCFCCQIKPLLFFSEIVEYATADSLLYAYFVI